MENLKFSIVIPAYNAAKFIERALESVRHQTYNNYEIVITNNGSTDGTEEIVNNYIKKYPQLNINMENQKHTGVGGSRNNALFRSSGDFIAFLDADDTWFPKKLEILNDYLKKNTTIDVVYHGVIEISDNDVRRVGKGKAIKEPFYMDLLLNGHRFSTSAAVIRSSIAKKIDGFSEDMRFNGAEDYEFWLRVAKTGAIFGTIEEVLGEYYNIDGNISSKIEYQHFNIYNVVKYNIELLYDEGNYSKRYIERLIKKQYMLTFYRIGRRYYFKSNYDNSIRMHIKAINNYPYFFKNYAGIMLSIIKKIAKNDKLIGCFNGDISNHYNQKRRKKY